MSFSFTASVDHVGFFASMYEFEYLVDFLCCSSVEMLSSVNVPAPFKRSIELHPDGPRVVLDPEPKTREQKELALKFLQSVTANLQLANAQLGQQLVAAQSTNAIEKHLREEKEADILLARERSLLKLINDLESELTGVKVHVDKLQSQLDHLLRKDSTVTLRQICRILERHLCLQVAGSKTQAKKNYFNFAKVKNDKTMFAELERDLQLRGFTSSTNFIDRLKDVGDAAVHQDRDCPTLDEFRAQLCDQNDDEEDRQNSMAFLKALESFGMVSSKGRIEISRDPLM